MREFKKHRSKRTEWARVLLGLAGIALLGFITFSAIRASWNMYGRFSAAAVARAESEQAVVELEKRKAALEVEVEALRSERGLEGEVRERYGYARPGEGQITIVRYASSSEVARKDSSFWERLRDLLFVW